MSSTVWVKIVLNVVAAALAGYGATDTLEGAVAAVGSALVALFQKAPQDAPPASGGGKKV